MILTDLWLSNFRKHKKLHIKLKQGVTGIVGRNGTGKSSIIEAIQFLLTGDLFDGSKDQAINLDSATGYVAGSFILNGKHGRLERHLDVSKVNLSYDGTEYKKSTEVKEIWDKLLQLNSEILKRVIIARQGHIPDMFSGDTAVREKVWQRIFLVPQTDKLRNIVWKDYIKQAPPIIPEESKVELEEAKEGVKIEVEQFRLELAEYNLLDDLALKNIQKRIHYVERCIADSKKETELAVALQASNLSREALDTQLQDILERLSSIAIDKYKLVNNTLLQQKGLHEQKEIILAQFGKLAYPISKDQYAEVTRQITTARVGLDAINRELAVTANKLLTSKEELNTSLNLKDHAVCPTCKQHVSNLDVHVAELNLLIASLEEEKRSEELKAQKLTADLDRLQKLEQAYSSVALKEQQLTESLKQFKNINFDQKMLDMTSEVIQEYDQLSDDKNKLELKLESAHGKHEAVKTELNSLTKYDRCDSPSDELDNLNQQLNVNNTLSRAKQQLDIKLQVKLNELNSLNNRIATAETNNKKNTARNKYVATLNKVYDVLHSSQFPRKLIMSYANVVTDYLQENLKMFDFPYTAKVADSFNIEVSDEQERVLPSVSGGQEIAIGLCLHLSLHDLFSQSFPMMVIDEGTTHLDSDNRKAYFDMIKGLKAKSKLKQILIIDHDPQIAEVVDNVIELKND
jgi:exonuclease SbcC